MALFRALFRRMYEWLPFEIGFNDLPLQQLYVRRKEKPAQLPVAKVVTRG